MCRSSKQIHSMYIFWLILIFPLKVCLKIPVNDELLSRRNTNGLNDDEDVYVSSGYMDPSSFTSTLKVKVTVTYYAYCFVTFTLFLTDLILILILWILYHYYRLFRLATITPQRRLTSWRSWRATSSATCTSRTSIGGGETWPERNNIGSRPILSR